MVYYNEPKRVQARAPACAIKCNKFVLLLFNALFFGTGVVLAVVGIWCLAGPGKTVIEALVPRPELMPTLVTLTHCLTGAGILVLLISVLGTWASLSESCCGLTMYITLVILVILAEGAVGVLAAIHQSQTVSDIAATLVKRLHQEYGMPNREDFTIAIDYIQYQLQCCGINDHKDWKGSRWKVESAGGDDWEVPLTCCTLYSDSDAHLNPKPFNMTVCQDSDDAKALFSRHFKGCASIVFSWIQSEVGLIAGVAAAVALLEIGGIVAAGALCKHAIYT